MKSRLSEIVNFVEKEYQEIWDTCCDHGKLGLTLFEIYKDTKIHFVDCIPEIMDKLEMQLAKQDLLSSPRIELHTKNAEDIKLSDEKSLICICGIGGIKAIEIISGLMRKNDLRGHDIILCVQYRTPKLRRFLRNSGFKVQKEMLCFEGKWAHEIMRISLDIGNDICTVGSPMFKLDRKDHINYITKSIKHYQKKCLIDKSYEEVLNLYRKVIPVL